MPTISSRLKDILVDLRTRAKLTARVLSHSGIDRLTELHNSDWLAAYLSSVSSNFQTYVYVDINGLKRENDLHGHTAGNQLLKNFSRSLDLLARQHNFKAVRLFFGDEFLLVSMYPTKGWQTALEEFKFEANGNCRFAYGIGASQETAEENMRTDKNNYYDRHPELDRRTDTDRREKREQEKKLVHNTAEIYTLAGQRVKVS
jgi:GGDEF domain-containing protein